MPGSATARPRVLLIDDEPSILSATQRMLSREFEVVGTTDPLAAIDMVAAGERYAAVVSDVQMPQLSGPELYSRIAAVAPELAARFVFVSGDLTREDIRGFLAGLPNERIEKPYEPQLLRSAVRRVTMRIV